MIWIVCRISFLRLWNNKQEMLVAFVVPLLFFSIFALIFSRGVGQPTTRVRVAFVDDDRTQDSARLIREACQQPTIQPLARVLSTAPTWPIDTLSRRLISQHRAEVVVHIPRGFTTQDPDAPTLSIRLLNEGGNPIGPRLVEASLAQSIALALSKANLPSEANPKVASPSSDSIQSPSQVMPASFREAAQSQALASTQLSSDSSLAPAGVASAVAATISKSSTVDASPDVVPDASTDTPQVFQSIDIFSSGKHQPKIALYAAGIAVMFLLFSAGSAGGSLLEEREAGTLGRLLSSRLTISQLLIGKWLYVMLLGFAQTTLMFGWGQLAFQVDLLGHWPGFLVMTLLTSAASASFGILLAAFCTSRPQLNALSMVLVLSMSAVGGSMVPRYVMSDTMKSLGKLTFNGWALDGYQKVFWYDMPLASLRTEICVMLMLTMLMAVAARVFAERWRLA